eukprot:CAMPEP_0168840386 /NCGR_PEP_ID=MMETSP0727-20121128/6641_1 /TAXON_ID=265536 /ORGANISM="Amphiprora sp., Strain CCMP467" /LENGTH=615 /DNA_ID=CAMNT_0008893889 /DNA_START=56 /DNA_END=1903 /DNA_ORIENTATION=+
MRKFFQAMAARRQKKKTENASLADYKDASTLKAALARGNKQKKKETKQPKQRSSVRGSQKSKAETASITAGSVHSRADSFDDRSLDSSDNMSLGGAPVEWQLPLVDEDVTEPQTMDQELKRLQALQSYFILDTEGEAQFDRITGLASQIFDTPIALVSLVDLGRQWFLSRVGLDATETARKHAFCAHVILNKYKILVVPNASQDIRFQNNPLVTDGLKIRFYAGAALVSPEGYKLGTLCVISPKVREEGLSEQQQEMLHSMADMVVQAMVSRRDRMLKQEYEQERLPALAHTLMETSKQLQISQKKIETILKTSDWNMNQEETVELTNLANDMKVQAQICDATTRNVAKEVISKDGVKGQTENASDEDRAESSSNSNNDFMEEALAGFDSIINPTTDMERLFHNLNSVVAKFPYRDQVTVELHRSVPKRIVAEDLLLFRSVLNLLTHCMAQLPVQDDNTIASSLQASGLIMRCSNRHRDELLVKAVQRGQPMSKERAHELFRDKDSLLAPVSSMVRSMGGKVGMYHSKWVHGTNASVKESELPTQSIFWFQIPFGLAETDAADPTNNQINESLGMTHESSTSSSVTDSPSSQQSQKSLQSDPFQQALLSAGCGGR